ncbi:MAG: 16S rRNA (guanine(527)-N(7))-methyltransferase RsmG [Marinagarivorans sp.]|nr:16S rRNA (guanine(527)-N(7))-methyltransferase RsmG [Marinagarivorans sp.]
MTYPQKNAANNSFTAERAQLLDGILQLGLDVTPAQVDLLMGYLALFVKWSKAYNLTAILKPKAMVTLHLLDSLAVAPHFEGQNVLDVGTGAGLPGIPLAILFPDTQFTLLDSAGKKIRFLFQVINELGLKNVQVQNLRVETFKPVDKFDVVISRAFASIADFVACTGHLLTENGQFWAMKGQNPVDELSQLKKHYIVASFQPLRVPGLDAERCLIRLQPQAIAS